VFHVLNRGVPRMQLFETQGDFQAFERALQETRDETPMRIWAGALMPNHWHLLLWPERDGDLATCMQRLSIPHVRRWQEHRHDVGLGRVDQGRYKSFPVESDERFLSGMRSGPIWSCGGLKADGSRFGSVSWNSAGRVKRQAAPSHALEKRLPHPLNPLIGRRTDPCIDNDID
jgi:REP element-mobilizing transposase RayT